MLELYYKLIIEYCDINKTEELEMDTESLYPALDEEELYDCIRPDKKREWIDLCSSDCADDFKGIATTKLFPGLAAQSTRIMTSANLDSSRENFVAQKGCVCAAKRIAVKIPNHKHSSLAAKN